LRAVEVVSCCFLSTIIIPQNNGVLLMRSTVIGELVGASVWGMLAWYLWPSAWAALPCLLLVAAAWFAISSRVNQEEEEEDECDDL
jgi:hypothetical protein